MLILILVYIGPYHIKEEGKQLMDKEMKRICHLGVLKEDYKCQILSLINLKDAIHSLRLTTDS